MMPRASCDALIEVARKPDIPRIMNLVNIEHLKSDALLEIDIKETSRWIEDGLSIVARLDEDIIAHQSAQVWPQSGWIEIRAAVVKEEFRNKGIFGKMVRFQVETILDSDPSATICTVKNKKSRGNRVLESIGFREVPPESVPQEIFTIGEGQEWRVFVLTAESYDRGKALLAGARC
jgi:N-acetylglutamate synthase-like GNAT family acetyltransferase